jgi:hypothetical protein
MYSKRLFLMDDKGSGVRSELQGVTAEGGKEPGAVGSILIIVNADLM